MARQSADLEYTSPLGEEGYRADILDRINSAFQDYANAAAIAASAPRPKECRDWCERLAANSRELLTGIGAELSETFVDHAAFDALEILKLGVGSLMALNEAEGGNTLRDKLHFALPDQYQPGDNQRPDPNVEKALYEIVGRLRPMLASLALMSDAAASAWGERIKKGKSKDVAADHLFRSLAIEYRILFGRWPETTWHSAGHVWMHRLIELAAAKASASPAEDQSATPRRVPRAPALLTLAKEVAPSKHKSHARQAALEHRISEGVKQALTSAAGKSADGLPKQARPPRR